MKILFAVSDKKILAQIVETYQKQYKEIISYKNIICFRGIVKELQRNKSYDRIVISEDLEPFANNNDAIDKFLFEKLDNISDEATGVNGNKIPIVLLATDKRIKSDTILTKLLKIGIERVLLEEGKNITNVCKFLNKPHKEEMRVNYYEENVEEIICEDKHEENMVDNEEAIQMQKEKSRYKYKILAFAIGLVVGYTIIKLLLK